ncbi:BPI fold-containing family A member 1-like [Notamacropus eugenii]|uniref:BPI fold-containing family A member 1-like n=1 Tax=Notamacropus eugenii TaxID=9315 RepID=UPI003B66E4F1
MGRICSAGVEEHTAHSTQNSTSCRDRAKQETLGQSEKAAAKHSRIPAQDKSQVEPNMKTLLLLGLVLLCGQFPRSLAQEKEEDSGVLVDIIDSLKNSVTTLLKDLSNADLLQKVLDTPVVGNLLRTLSTLTGGLVSFDINNADLLKISLQENEGKESLSLSVPLDFSVTVNTVLFGPINVTVKADSELELAAVKGEDGQPQLSVTKCQTSSQLLNISYKNLKFLGSLLNIASTAVSEVVKAAVNQLVCPLVKTAVELVPPGLVEGAENLIRGNVIVAV